MRSSNDNFSGSRKGVAIDRLIGARVRSCREALDISVGEAARACGMALQIYAQCETGAKRFGAAKLFQLTMMFEVPISQFFEGLDGLDKNSSHAGEANLPPLDADIEFLQLCFAQLSERDRVAVIKFANKLCECSTG